MTFAIFSEKKCYFKDFFSKKVARVTKKRYICTQFRAKKITL